MGIIEEYLNEADPSSTIKSSGLIQQYLDAGKDEISEPKKELTPKPPISGISKESSDELNATRIAKEGTKNPRRGVLSIPTKAAERGWEAAKGGVLEAGKGLGETLSGKPASGLGKVGMGALQVFGSPWEATGSVAADVTGDPTFGSKVGLGIVGAVPLAKALPYAPFRMPTGNNLNPFQAPHIRPSKNKALSELVDDITAGGKDQQALVDTVNAMKADPRIGPADVSSNVLGATQRLFVKEGEEAKNYLHKTSKERLSKLGDDTASAFDEAAGTPVNVKHKLNELSAAAKKAGSDIINPAIAAAGPVNISKTVDAIDEVLKPGIWKSLEDAKSTLPTGAIKAELRDIRAMLANKKEMQTDAKTLHEFQYTVRERAADLLKSTVGSETQLGKALMNVRNNIVNDINAVSPKIKIMKDGVETEVGQYKHGLNVFREEKDLADAFREGYKSSAKGMERDPNFTRDWFDGLTDYEKEAAREGKRLSISHKMGRSENPSLAGSKAARSDFDKQELEIFFGKEGTDKLLQNLENMRAIKNTDQKVIEGSQTAARIAADKKSDMPERSKMDNAVPYVAEGMGLLSTGYPAVGALAYQGMKGISAIAHKAKTAVQQERNAQYARYALPTEGPSRDELIRQLESRISQPKLSILNRARMAVSP